MSNEEKLKALVWVRDGYNSLIADKISVREGLGNKTHTLPEAEATSLAAFITQEIVTDPRHVIVQVTRIENPNRRESSNFRITILQEELFLEKFKRLNISIPPKRSETEAHGTPHSGRGGGRY